MIRGVVVLLVLLVGLAALDRGLARADRERETHAIGALLTDGERARVGANVAAVRLFEPGAAEPLLFARVRGEWRCVSLAGAPASTRAIQRVVDELFAARGIAMAEADAADASVAAYGLAAGDRYEISFHGTQVLTAADADTLLAVQVGRGARGGAASRSFARVVRRESDLPDEIVALDRDLVELLEPRPATGLPALLDPHVVPASWSTRAQGPRRIRVERLGSEAYTLELEGERWFLVGGEGERRECHRLLARGYTLFLARVPFAAVLPKQAAGSSGLESPRGIVSVTPIEGEELVLTLGDATARGEVVVQNGETGNVFAVASEIVPLLLPEPDALVDPERGNPWDPYLRDG